MTAICIPPRPASVALRMRVLRACQGSVPIARLALDWVNEATDEADRADRLECLCLVAPRALRDTDGTELLKAARQALRWVREEGSRLPPAQVTKSRNTSLHAPKLRQEHGACPLPQGSEFAPK